MQSQVLIIPPANDTEGAVAAFVRRCVLWGIDFCFESNDRLPTSMPSDIEGVRAVFIDVGEVEANRAALDACRAQGTQVYELRTKADPSVPNGTQSWAAVNLLHMATVDAGLTTNNSILRKRLLARDENVLFGRLVTRLCETRAELWYDATSYNWDMMLDVSEVTGEDEYASSAYEQMRRMMYEVENDLVNCDCIAPFRPMLRAAKLYEDHEIVTYVKEHVDRYLEITPKYRECLTNFMTYCRHARTEVLWQVLPSILMLANVTEDDHYALIVHEQFEKFHNLLFDQSRGLWCHAIGPAGTTDAFWARGVGFTLMANVLLLEMTSSQLPMYNKLLKTFQDNCASFGILQSSEGFFYSVVDDSSTQRESSGTAFIAAALMRGQRFGFIHNEYESIALKAYNAVLTRIWDGDFPGHSTATTASHVEGYYHKVQLSDTGWAHFALRPLCEKRRNGCNA